MKFILVRHCTTEWNLNHKLQGQTDIPLCETGIKEAEALAEILRELKIGKIVSSDLSRAAATAEIISSKIHAEVALDPRLRECAFGSLEGLHADEAAKIDGSQKWDRDGKYSHYDYKPFGGETRGEVLARHLEVINENKFFTGRVLLVGHGRGLNTLLSGLGLEPNLKRGEYRVIENYKKIL